MINSFDNDNIRRNTDSGRKKDAYYSQFMKRSSQTWRGTKQQADTTKTTNDIKAAIFSLNLSGLGDILFFGARQYEKQLERLDNEIIDACNLSRGLIDKIKTLIDIASTDNKWKDKNGKEYLYKARFDDARHFVEGIKTSGISLTMAERRSIYNAVLMSRDGGIQCKWETYRGYFHSHTKKV